MVVESSRAYIVDSGGANYSHGAMKWRHVESGRALVECSRLRESQVESWCSEVELQCTMW